MALSGGTVPQLHQVSRNHICNAEGMTEDPQISVALVEFTEEAIKTAGTQLAAVQGISPVRHDCSCCQQGRLHRAADWLWGCGGVLAAALGAGAGATPLGRILVQCVLSQLGWAHVGGWAGGCRQPDVGGPHMGGTHLQLQRCRRDCRADCSRDGGADGDGCGDGWGWLCWLQSWAWDGLQGGPWEGVGGRGWGGAL